MKNDILEILISEDEIREKVKELGELITRDYKDKDLLIVGVLKGCVIFLSDLVREIKLPLLWILWWFPVMVLQQNHQGW